MAQLSIEQTAQLHERGVPYLDVRTEEEFAEGHVPGAWNVPVQLRGGGGMVENPEFVQIVEASFAKGDALLVGCRSGMRSQLAIRLLEAHGFTTLDNVQAGFAGGRDAFGRPLAGWEQEGRPVETVGPEDRRYPALRVRAGL